MAREASPLERHGVDISCAAVFRAPGEAVAPGLPNLARKACLKIMPDSGMVQRNQTTLPSH